MSRNFQDWWFDGPGRGLPEGEALRIYQGLPAPTAPPEGDANSEDEED